MSEPSIKGYVPERDRNGVLRVWRDCGWVDTETQEKGMDALLEANTVRVAQMNGTIESVVCTGPGALRYRDEDIPLVCVSGVTTSRLARRLGLARRLVSAALAAAAAEGALVSELSVFDQGFYNRLGFCSGPLEVGFAFDPATLRCDAVPRPAVRLTADDWEAMHANRLCRRRPHGAVNIDHPGATRAETLWAENGFGFGFRDGAGGALSHHAWLSAKDAERGPYRLWWAAFQTKEQLMELLAVVRSWSDQVPLVRMTQPPGVQLQDLLRRPFRALMQTADGRFAARITAGANWQLRILDLAGCLEHTHLAGPEVTFQLALRDPIAECLPEDARWRGIAGDYVVTLGETCSATPGVAPRCPMLRASIGAFSRLWIGAGRATSLFWTDELDGPRELLAALDRVFAPLPAPHPDWEF